MFLVFSSAAFASGEAVDNAAYLRLEDVMVLRVAVFRPTAACCLHSHRVNMPKKLVRRLERMNEMSVRGPLTFINKIQVKLIERRQIFDGPRPQSSQDDPCPKLALRSPASTKRAQVCERASELASTSTASLNQLSTCSSNSLPTHRNTTMRAATAQ